jgi:hypothetical protein
MYKESSYFKEVYEACENPVNRDRSPYMNHIIKDILVFKGSQLCIPKCSMKDWLVTLDMKRLMLS